MLNYSLHKDFSHIISSNVHIGIEVVIQMNLTNTEIIILSLKSDVKETVKEPITLKFNISVTHVTLDFLQTYNHACTQHTSRSKGW